VFLEPSVLGFMLFLLESSEKHGVLETHIIDLPPHQLLVKLYWNVQVETEIEKHERYGKTFIRRH